MRRYDCSKTMQFVHEYKRMCDSYNDECHGCPLDEKDYCFEIADIKQEAVDIVQKWSDEHQVKTRQDALLEVLPDAKTFCGYINIMPCLILEDSAVRCGKLRNKNCNECRLDFWSAPYEEVKK